MQPACSLQPCGASPTLASQGSTTGIYQLEEKQLFERFWRGTFKAVATPRPESVIVASITARRRVTNSETTACLPLKSDEGKVSDTRVDTADRTDCIRGKRRKHHHHSHHRARSPSFDEELSPRPKGKKKKRKSERKRKRKRSPSYSLSPPRKKKKKKKKSSKKSKRHRYTSKKSKHSSSSLKHKRKDERKHKKSSRTHTRRRRRYRRSESESSYCQSSAEDRHHLQKSEVHQTLGDLEVVVEETNGVLGHTKWRPATKSVCKTAPKYRSFLSTATILSPKPGSELLHGKVSQHLPSQADGPQHDYDSGNDTSSPPSSKTGVSSRASVTDNQRGHCKRLASLTDRDNVSDSGNSVTSYASLCKPYGDDNLSAAIFSGNGKREQITVGCSVEVVRSPKTSSCSQTLIKSSRKRVKRHSPSSRSRSRSSGSSRYSGRYSRSLSLSSCSSYSRSPSYSDADVRRRGSVSSLSSRGSYSRHSADRLRGKKRKPSSREKNPKHAHKVSGKRRRRKSYSPMKKRRRDSPSHLEARRITSARKRPIPYFRPSPCSSSRSTSVSSWSSLFTRSRSRSPSSYRDNSRSSSWNSIFGTRSLSRSRSPILSNKRKKHRH